MKIMMISPKHGRGLTTVSALLADMCARELSIPCILSQTDPLDGSLNKYLDLSRGMDKTMSIRQISKLLEVGEISGNDIKDYTVKRGKLGIFDIYDNTVLRSQEDVDLNIKLLNKVLSDTSKSIAFIDVADEIYEEEVSSLIDDADYFMLVIDQSTVTTDQLLAIQETDYWKKFKERDFLVIVNNFNKNISSLDVIAKKLGIRRSKILKIGYNPLIVKQANDGTLLYVNDFGLDEDFRYIDITNDLLDCVDTIAKNLAIAYKRKKVRR